MSVSCYFGLTESGKSYHVQNHVIPSWKKIIVFDKAHCFKGNIFHQPTDETFLKIFRENAGLESFTLVIRPGRVGILEPLFNKTVRLALALGRTIPGRVDPGKRIQMITDEADFVCSSHYQSKELKQLVNMGRHDNVDCHFIARSPARIHTDIRVNSTKIVTFQLQNAANVELFKNSFGGKIAANVQKLPKFWRLEWKDNGETTVYNEKNKEVETTKNKSNDVFEKAKILS